jgi:multidrug resistance efflux pump
VRRKQDVLLDMAKLKLDFLEECHERAKELVKDKTISVQEYRQALLDVQLAKLDVELAEIDASQTG